MKESLMKKTTLLEKSKKRNFDFKNKIAFFAGKG